MFWRYEGRCDDVFEGEGRLECNEFVHTGGFSRCVRHGVGRTVWARDGGEYSGEFSWDRFGGRGEKVYGAADRARTGVAAYSGAWCGGLRHGVGRQSFVDGRVYEGEFVDDRICGVGRMAYPDGGVYEGRMLGERREGRGVHRYADGGVYNGVWVSDMREDRAGAGAAGGEAGAAEVAGAATEAAKVEGVPSFTGFVEAGGEGTSSMVYADGSFYFGQFVADKREGVGYLRSPDGKISFTGQFVADRREGRGVWRDENRGESYDGHFERDKMHGFGKQHAVDGSTYEGLFCYNTRHSPARPARLWTADGAYYCGCIDQGLRHDTKAIYVNAAGDRYVGTFASDVQTVSGRSGRCCGSGSRSRALSRRRGPAAGQRLDLVGERGHVRGGRRGRGAARRGHEGGPRVRVHWRRVSEHAPRPR